jgi:hypothetical protein
MGQGGRKGRALIGRDAQRATAQTHLRLGSGVLLAGAPGVGKTEFARALLDGIDGNGTHHVQWLTAGAAGPTIPFGAFAPLFPEVGGQITDRRQAFDVLQRLRRAVIAGAADKDLMLVVDDAHRLDEASATLVFQLVSAGTAAAVVTVRTGTAMPEASGSSGRTPSWSDSTWSRSGGTTPSASAATFSAARWTAI